MLLKERLQFALVHARNVTEKILVELDRPEDWIVRPAVEANHALWITGHLAVTDNRLTRLIDKNRMIDLSDWHPLFGKGSSPIDDLSAYPTPDEVLERLRERRENLLDVLQACSETDFNKPTPEGAPFFMPNVGYVFQMAAWHEALHTGQLTIIHRKLGKTPLADRPR